MPHVWRILYAGRPLHYIDDCALGVRLNGSTAEKIAIVDACQSGSTILAMTWFSPIIAIATTITFGLIAYFNGVKLDLRDADMAEYV